MQSMSTPKLRYVGRQHMPQIGVPDHDKISMLHSKVSHDVSASHVQQGESSTVLVLGSCKPISSMTS